MNKIYDIITTERARVRYIVEAETPADALEVWRRGDFEEQDTDCELEGLLEGSLIAIYESGTDNYWEFEQWEDGLDLIDEEEDA